MGPEGWWEGTETFKSLERILEAQHKGTWLRGVELRFSPCASGPPVCPGSGSSLLLYTIALGSQEVVLKL